MHDLTWVLVLIAVLGIGSQLFAARLGVPAIVLLTGTGLLFGPGLDWIRPSAEFGPLLHPVIGLSVAVILFEGGLNLKVHEFRAAAVPLKRLVSAGVVISWTLASLASHYVGGLSWAVSLLFGAITVVTGPTVIIPLLRHTRLKRRPASFLKWEGIVNDPVGALLTVLVYEFLVHAGSDGAYAQLLFGLLWAALSSALLGVGGGYLLGQAFRRGLVPEFLKPPVLLVAVLVVYALANLAQEEAGLLAATIFGVTLGNMRLPSIGELHRFKEYVTVLLVSGLFIILTADTDPAALARLDWRSAALLLALLFVVRPVSVLLATVRTDMDWRERALVAWIAPRGIVAAAVAGVLGPRMVEHGYGDGELLVPLVFALILLTVVVHGFSIGRLARGLGLAAARRNGVLFVGASPWTAELAGLLSELKVPVMVADSSWHRLKPARLAGIRVYYGEILSQATQHVLELNDISWLLAATSNDAYNALVCTHFAQELGRRRVLQLPMLASDENEPKGVAYTLRGLTAFDEGAVYEALLERHYRGWGFRKTRITEAFGYEAYQEQRLPGALDLLLVREDGEVWLNSPRFPLEPVAGDVVVSFSPAQSAKGAEGREKGRAEPVPARA